jgi:hypothetical protein
MDATKTKYVHYGNNKFNKNEFRPIKNRQFQAKPNGGFWGSRVDAQFGWKDWCESECFAECKENNKIEFALTENARIFNIHSVADAKKLKEIYAISPDEELSSFGLPYMFTTVDFEKMTQDYDGIEFFLSDDDELYHELYLWDCDSIVIFNPEVIIELNKEIIKSDISIAEDVLSDNENFKGFTTFKNEEIVK